MCLAISSFNNQLLRAILHGVAKESLSLKRQRKEKALFLQMPGNWLKALPMHLSNVIPIEQAQKKRWAFSSLERGGVLWTVQYYRDAEQMICTVGSKV